MNSNLNGLWCGDGRLYGRVKETELLLEAYENGPSCGASFIVITGPTGVGKTTLVTSTLRERVTQDGGYFLEGKVERTRALHVPPSNHRVSSVFPYAPFDKAMSTYSQVMLKEGNEERRALLKDALQARMDWTEMLVIQQAFPSVGGLFENVKLMDSKRHQYCGKWSLRGMESEFRFRTIFTKFMTTIATLGYPLVVFLDDIHWLHPAAKDLLLSMAKPRETERLQLIWLCTYRTDGATDWDHVSKFEAELKEKQSSVVSITLSGIDEKAVNELLSRTSISQCPLDWQELASMLYKNTNGNPLFVHQQLKVFHEGGALQQTGSSWMGQACSIAESRNLTQMIADEMNSLPKSAKEVLQVASCLGFSLCKSLLNAASSKPTCEVAEMLQVLQQQGLVILEPKLEEIHFTHDIIQEAAYLLIPEQEIPSFLLNVGRRLLYWLHPTGVEQHIFLVVELFNHGAHLINEQEERDELAEALLLAGEKAAMMSCFSTATEYLGRGIALLGPNHWKNRYRLSLRLFNTASELEYYNGNIQRVDELVNAILHHAYSLDDALVAHFTRIYARASQGEGDKALDEAVNVLQMLGENFPKKVKMPRIIMEMVQCNRILRGKSDDDILNLAPMSDKRRLTVMRLLNVLYIAAFTQREVLMPLIASRATQITLHHGMNEMSCLGISFLGIVYALRGKIDKAYRFALLALRIFEMHKSIEWQGRLGLNVHAFVFPLKRPLQESIKPLLAAHHASLVLGDIHCSIWCASLYSAFLFYTGTPLLKLMPELESFRELAQTYGQDSSVVDILLQLSLNLMGRSENPLVMTGEAMSEEELTSSFQKKFPAVVVAMLMAKLLLAVHFNAYDDALQICQRLNKLPLQRILPYTLSRCWFFQGMTAAACSARSRKQRGYALKFLSKLKCFAKHSPHNYNSKVLLISGELAAKSQKYDEAILDFKKSIECSKQSRFIDEQGLACERAGHALLACGRHAEALLFFAEAKSLYGDWGAVAKENLCHNLMMSVNSD